VIAGNFYSGAAMSGKSHVSKIDTNSWARPNFVEHTIKGLIRELSNTRSSVSLESTFSITFALSDAEASPEESLQSKLRVH